MKYYPRHIGDYIRDTVGLSMVEDGCYTRLLDQYYATERPLPDDVQKVYRMARASTPVEREAVDYVLSQFFVHGDDGWRQKRADREIEIQHERSESARQSASHRWSKGHANAMRTHSERNANGMREKCVGNANHEPRTKNHEENQREGGLPPPNARAREPGATPADPPRKRGSRLSPDWALPDAWRAWASEERPHWSDIRITAVSEAFRDHWLGNGTPRVDWEATWRNWVRRERDVVPARHPAQPTNIAAKRAAVRAEIWKHHHDPDDDIIGTAVSE